VRLEDAVECEDIFSTLMGENVENRRKFIEETPWTCATSTCKRATGYARRLHISVKSFSYAPVTASSYSVDARGRRTPAKVRPLDFGHARNASWFRRGCVLKAILPRRQPPHSPEC
jgi:hypothetical protein